MARPLSQIASEISRDWRPVNYAAKPYLDAMFSLDSIKDNYMMDSGSSIVAYFLSNATSWRGETAKRIKKELNAMLKSREGVEGIVSGLLTEADEQFKVGDIVKHKASFLKSTGWYTNVPKNGKVVALKTFGGKLWPVVQWSDGGEPGLINPGNVRLASKPDYSGM